MKIRLSEIKKNKVIDINIDIDNFISLAVRNVLRKCYCSRGGFGNSTCQFVPCGDAIIRRGAHDAQGRYQAERQ